MGSWNLLEDYKTSGLAVAQSSWNLGVMDIVASDDFTAVAGLKSFEEDGNAQYLVSDDGKTTTIYADGISYQDWGTVGFTPSNGTITFVPGDRYPSVVEFTAPLSGVFGLNTAFGSNLPLQQRPIRLLRLILQVQLPKSMLDFRLLLRIV